MCKIEFLKHVIWADSDFYISTLQRCARLNQVAEGRCAHAHMIKTGFGPHIFMNNNLASMYAKCGFLNDAHKVFDRMPERSVPSWNGIIAGCVQRGQSEKAVKLFRQMQQAGMKPNQFTFGSMLSWFAMNAHEEGKQLHALVVKSGFEFDLFVQSAIVDLYAKCMIMEDARKVFDKMPERDVVSWNAIIAGYVQNGYGERALKVFCEMQWAGMCPNHFTFTSVLKACAEDVVPESGKVVHAHVIKSQLEMDACVWNAVIDMYAKCGSIRDAHYVFEEMPKRDAASWNAMLVGYAQNGHGEDALNLFGQMQIAGVKLDEFTFSTLFKACYSLAALEQGNQIHGLVIKTGYECNVFVATTLIEMLENHRNMECAIQLFDSMPDRDVILWSVIIAGYVQQGEGIEALNLFYRMQRAGLKPDHFTFCSALKACSILAALEQGKQVHIRTIQTGYQLNIFVCNSLVDMYAKSGSIEGAYSVFSRIPKADLASWNAMISGYAHHGHGRKALELFREMEGAGVKPDHITFVSILYACSHGGLVDEGCYHFDNMIQCRGITPRPEHFACMLDLLCRAGHLEEAKIFINKMPFKPSPVMWRTLLSACRLHCNMELGERVAEHLLKLGIQDAATCTLLSNLYATAGRWDEVANVRKMMNDGCLKKEAGVSWIEIKSTLHKFLSGEYSFGEAA